MGRTGVAPNSWHTSFSYRRVYPDIINVFSLPHTSPHVSLPLSHPISLKRGRGVEKERTYNLLLESPSYRFPLRDSASRSERASSTGARLALSVKFGYGNFGVVVLYGLWSLRLYAKCDRAARIPRYGGVRKKRFRSMHARVSPIIRAAMLRRR